MPVHAALDGDPAADADIDQGQRQATAHRPAALQARPDRAVNQDGPSHTTASRVRSGVDERLRRLRERVAPTGTRRHRPDTRPGSQPRH